ncbi:hypothetical protein [Streptomyces sp. BE133]|uniref:hypothetical protein n=1 Tax=Streptomyces sp. BE133 TaxID=3002523 RepID=UPI002E778CB4|nr:hypothetical protein [Streptomyces sp. BE133]MEE1805840.1 hypothetical protein [Streptomyces sp. BE133]
MVWEPHLDGYSDEQLKDLRDQFGDVWYALSILLGHSHPDTTRDHCLAPFTGLHVDYLMALLDEDEQNGMEPLVRVAVTATGVALASVDNVR